MTAPDLAYLMTCDEWDISESERDAIRALLAELDRLRRERVELAALLLGVDPVKLASIPPDELRAWLFKHK